MAGRPDDDAIPCVAGPELPAMHAFNLSLQLEPVLSLASDVSD